MTFTSSTSHPNRSFIDSRHLWMHERFFGTPSIFYERKINRSKILICAWSFSWPKRKKELYIETTMNKKWYSRHATPLYSRWNYGTEYWHIKWERKRSMFRFSVTVPIQPKFDFNAVVMVGAPIKFKLLFSIHFTEQSIVKFVHKNVERHNENQVDTVECVDGPS